MSQMANLAMSQKDQGANSAIAIALMLSPNVGSCPLFAVGFQSSADMNRTSMYIVNPLGTGT